ncbi:MAG: Rrf2 family transcriptional regulator [Oscillospiraceae bacterium]|jgi:Rrf2 family protein|nr:Rrf2 family transcriptional regulator [Oscillospiraceae bacterium]
MKISAKAHSALRMMLCIAERGGDGYLSLKDVAAQLGASKPYLEQIMIQLGKTNLLITARGASGGYKLAAPASRISAAQVVRAVEGELTLIPSSDGDADDTEIMARDVWQGLTEVVTSYLESVSLQDMLDTRQTYQGYDFSI